jgi:multidrug resistance efflux pump
MTRTRAILVLAGILVVIVAGGLLAATQFRPAKKSDDAPRTEIVRKAPMLVKIRETGVLESLVSVNVKSNVDGEIKRLAVREGDHVEAGQVLIQLDDKQIREETNQAEANLRAATAQWEQAQRNVGLTDVRQVALLAQAEDAEKIANASLEASRRTSTQQTAAAEIEIASTETALEQDRIALNQARIAEKQAELSRDTARSQLEAARVTVANAEAELRRFEELYAKKFASKSALETAQSRYAQAKNQFEQAEKSVLTQEEALKSQREAVTARQNAVENRQKVLDYQRENLDSLRLSRGALDRQAELQLQTAQARLTEVLRSIEPEKQNSASSLTVAHANLLRAQSALKTAQERLGWTRILAPMSGTVVALVVEEGEIVQSGRVAFGQLPAIMAIADLSQMVIKTYVNEVDMPRIEVGQKVEVRSDAYPDRVFDGRVKTTSPQAQMRENVTKFEVEIEVLGSPPELRPGMNVDVDIVVADRQDVVQLPIETLIEKTKLTVSAAVPPEQLGSLQRNQRVEVESRAGKRFPGRIVALRPEQPQNVVVFVDEDAPKGLRVGDQTTTIVLKKEGRKEDTGKIEDVPANVESERKQLVLVPDPAAESKAKKGGLLSWLPFLPSGAKNGRPRGIETEMKVGLRNDTAFEIVQGLSPGDEVLIPEVKELVTNRPQP